MSGAHGQGSGGQDGGGPTDQVQTSQEPRKGGLAIRVGAKHVAVAVGVLVLAVGGLVFALMGDQPDFVCRLSGECKRSGLCVGNRFSCTVGTSADCHASEVCRKEGLCSSEGGTCAAASDQDCAGSEACKKEEHCAQLQGRCTTEWQRAQIRAVAERETASKAVGEYLPLVSNDYRQFETTPPHLEAAEWGTAKFNGRVLPAAIVRASITITDRLAGERRPTCTIVAAVNDGEFKMWRAKAGFMCRGPKLAEELAQWRADSGFTVTGSWAEAPAVALGGPSSKNP